MKKFIYFAVGIATMLMAASCEKDAYNNTSGEGGFSLALSVNNKDVVTTRATMDENEIIADAKVDIYMPNFSGKIRSYTYGDMEEVVYLPTGEGYRVDVTAGEAAKASPDKATFENKSYAGSADFDIVANQIDGVKVTAKITNAITNVTFDETIAANFDTYNLSFALADMTDANATVADDDKLVYGKATTDGEVKTGEGYFIVDNPVTENKLYWLFEGKKTDGTAFTAKGAIEAPEATGNSLVGTRHNMNFKYVVKDGKLIFTLVVDETTDAVQDKVIWTPTSTGLSTLKAKDIWAKFVTVSADVDTAEYDGDVYFQYRETSDAEWVNPDDASALKVKATADDKGVFKAVITGLEPETTYDYRLVVYDTVTAEDNTTSQQWVEDVVSVKDFTTTKDQQVPNASFEQTYNTGNFDVFNPQAGYGFSTTTASEDPGNAHTWWGTGNQVAAGGLATVAVTATSTDVPYSSSTNKASVCMTSKVTYGMLAAGNIYSGYFYTLHGTEGGTVHFGRTTADDGSQFVSRPTGVSFYVKYISTQVKKANGGGLTTSDMDEGQVKFAIGNWSNSKGGGSKECPIAINTTESGNNPLPAQWNLKTFDGTIAYAEMIFTSEHNDDGWMKVTIPFDYNNTSAKPTHILISAASSRCGDYFTGGEGSTMYLDDIELLYDYETSQLTGPKIEVIN